MYRSAVKWDLITYSWSNQISIDRSVLFRIVFRRFLPDYEQKGNEECAKGLLRFSLTFIYSKLNCSLRTSVSHFVELGFSPSTVYRIWKKYFEHGTTVFLLKSGRTPKISDNNKWKYWWKAWTARLASVSEKKTRRFGVSQSTVPRTSKLLTAFCYGRTWPTRITLAKCKHS